MIIHKCDICNKVVIHLDSIILYKKKFDYCRNCAGEAEKIKQEFKKECDFEYVILDSRLRAKERECIKSIKNINTTEFEIKE